jgi:hypothetical protein
MEDISVIVPIKSPSGEQLFRVEARACGGREKVSALDGFSKENLEQPILAIASTVLNVLQAVSPKRATVEFGIEIAVESGQLTALLCKGSGKANLNLSLEWGGDS